MDQQFHRDEPYQVVRFCVVSNGTGDFSNTSGSVYWNLSEFAMWGSLD